MPFNDLHALFNSPQYLLPYLEVDEFNSYLHLYSCKIDAYFEDVKLLPDSAIGNYDKTDLLDRLSEIITKLKHTLKLYLDGYPSLAYNSFNNLIESCNLETELNERRTVSMPSNASFYRIKKEFTPNNPAYDGVGNGFKSFLSGIDLFHVPFEKRRAIGTNRFSIPGFPCVYVSDDLITSWSEADLNVAELFHAVCLSNHRPLYFADIVPIQFIDLNNNPYLQKDPNQVLIDYIFMYPLILACHSKIIYKPLFDGEVKFKSEYIIPQLLLQWYREKKIIVDGIRYFSCIAQAKFPVEKFNKFNYVIPVYESNETGYCPSLIYNFSATPVYSYINTSRETIFEILGEIKDCFQKESFEPLQKPI